MDCVLTDCREWKDVNEHCSCRWCAKPGGDRTKPNTREDRCLHYQPLGWNGVWLWPAGEDEPDLVAGPGTTAAECPGAMGLPPEEVE